MYPISFGFISILAFFSSSFLTLATPWPYTRAFTNGTVPPDEHDDHIPNQFLTWLKSAHDASGQLANAFVNNSIPQHVRSFVELESYFLHYHATHPREMPKVAWDTLPPPDQLSSQELASALFSNLPFQLEPSCVDNKSKFWYRQPNGGCNWLKRGEHQLGTTFSGHPRDFNQTAYADGVSTPRVGPNPREVSNAFFKRKARLYYEHTPLLLGLIEFLMHDVSYSADSETEWIDVPIPAGDPAYDPHSFGNASFRVSRTKAADGTGTGIRNPRQPINEATAWLDASALYGSTEVVADALRSHVDGKLKAQRGKDGFEYLPLNVEGLPMRTRPGVDPRSLFLGGDVRTNEDWIMLSVNTLLLREHNRICDLIVGLNPGWNDERVYQTARLIVGTKIALIANSYQMAYWTDKMPWPRDDGFPLYRGVYNVSALAISPLHMYPWPMAMRDNNPTITSAEMSIAYRFHEFIISSFPIKDEHNKTLQECDVFNTAFDTPGYLAMGADKILRGMLATDIPNFKSGVDEEFRSAGKYRGRAFDIVVWSIVHEREQGLPTFNQYFDAYNNADPKPALSIPIRKSFEEFSSDPEMVAELRRLYKSPDDVDLIVGVQLEETLFPGTTVPVTALVASLLSLFGVGSSDRFSAGYASMRCLLVDKPWNCHPSNALEELLWAPHPTKEFPFARGYDSFWMAEMDFQAHGTNLLWRLITENSGAKCIQKNPLFPFDPQTNPILCELVRPKKIPWNILASAGAILMGSAILVQLRRPRLTPPTTWGSFVVGVGQKLQADPKNFLAKQARLYGEGKTFGLRLFGPLVYYVGSSPQDIDIMKNDELRASVHAIGVALNQGSLLGQQNNAEDLFPSFIRRKFETERSETLPQFAEVVSQSMNTWLTDNPLDGNIADISDRITHLSTYITSRVCLGPQGFDDAELLEAFIGFNSDAATIFQISALLPPLVGRIFSNWKVHKHSRIIKKKLLPLIRERRKRHVGPRRNVDADDLLEFMLDVTDDDTRIVGLICGIILGTLQAISAAIHNGLYDVASSPGLQASIRCTEPANHIIPDSVTRGGWNSWRSVTLETLRLSAGIFGPVRQIIVRGFKLGSDPRLSLPKGSVFAVSPYLVHYNQTIYPNAGDFVPDRFAREDAMIGSSRYLTFGLPAHTCPGRFFAIQTISIVLNTLVSKYEFKIGGSPSIASDRYNYAMGQLIVYRKPLPLLVSARVH